MKISLTNILSGFNLNKVNENFQKIQDELNYKVMYRDNPMGETNTIITDVDMNGNALYNLPAPVLPSQAARLQDIIDSKSGLNIATLTTFSPYKDVSSTTVQGAIQELKDDIDAVIPTAASTATTNATSAATANISATLAANTGAGTVGWVQTGTGATNRTVSDKLKERISVKDFGATGDGVTNDTAAFTAARAITVNYYIPNGVYVLNASPDVFADGFTAGNNVTLSIAGVSYNVSNAFSGGLRYSRSSNVKLDMIDAKSGNTVMYYQNGAPGTATGFYRGLAFTTDSHFLQAQPASTNGSTDLLFQRSVGNADSGGNRFNFTFEESTDRVLHNYATTTSGAPSFDSAITINAGTSPKMEFPALKPRFSQGWRVTTRADGNFIMDINPSTDRHHIETGDLTKRFMTFKADGSVGFFGAGGTTKPTITGSRGGNAALLDLITKLAAMGLVLDGTSA